MQWLEVYLWILAIYNCVHRIWHVYTMVGSISLASGYIQLCASDMACVYKGWEYISGLWLYTIVCIRYGICVQWLGVYLWPVAIYNCVHRIWHVYAMVGSITLASGYIQLCALDMACV